MLLEKVEKMRKSELIEISEEEWYQLVLTPEFAQNFIPDSTYALVALGRGGWYKGTPIQVKTSQVLSQHLN